MKKPPEQIPLNASSAQALHTYLRDIGSSLSPHEAASAAVDAWLAEARLPRELHLQSVRGYQWKCLFLPDGTDVRMCFCGINYFARVDGDVINYEGTAVSPRQLTAAIAGDGRNAWRDLWLRLPGEDVWQRASARRQAQHLMAARPASSPADALGAAAACMTEVLRSTLLLVDKINAQSSRQFERRTTHARRNDDVLADTCALD